MRSPRDFFRPLALGAPEPLRDIPVRPSRMIHFFDPSNPKMAEKAPGIAAKVDIILGNLEDAVAIDNLDRMIRNYGERGVRFVFAGMKGHVRDLVRRAGWYAKYGDDICHASVLHALKALGKAPNAEPR